ncbi:FAD binding domain-containing protein [Immersiella caudata]|uniref:FAD binding domain-containing protein n=1 Tax=Immersiella caudata TaxID=314043 RepID=A0AA39XFU0_9PEZI|nr:FAD binding domain-containing protein [Immersiella caudata]
MAAGKERPTPPRPHCKAIPGTASWPSEASWARFNESVNGRLLQPTPPGAVCHPGQPTFNDTQCVTVNATWSTYEFHAADPVSVDWNQWANDTCLPWPGYHCRSDGYPKVVLNASTAAHVKAGVDFARKHKVRLVVKSSGHDYVGRSNAPNSLSIWTHHLKKDFKFHDSFRPKNCNIEIRGTAVTAGAGAEMIELYTALDSRNQTVVGGGGKTVSLGGYITGGGHSLLSARHGLAADQVLEVELVTPKGDIVTANECTNSDLFWALRGGGGSTFGILTSLTLRTHPTPSISTRIVMIITSDNKNPSTFDMIAYVLSQFPSLGDSGLAGYSFLFSSFPNPFDNNTTPVSGMMLLFTLQDQPPTAIDDLLAPLLTHINTTYPSFTLLTVPEEHPSFSAWYASHYDTSATGANILIGSRLLPRSALTSNLTASASALRQFVSPLGFGTAYLVSGKGVHDATPRGGSNAVNPGWRTAYVHATNLVGWAPGSATEREDAMARLDRSLEGMRELSPDSGAYVNEANPYESNWQGVFWGSNYKRLLQIKRAVDPDDVLWCHPCVGNEKWHEVDGHLCRVKG